MQSINSRAQRYVQDDNEFFCSQVMPPYLSNKGMAKQLLKCILGFVQILAL